MCKIQPTEVTVTADARITYFDRVGSHITDLRRPHQKPIAIKFQARAVVVEMQTALNGITLANKVLPKNIRNVDVLMAGIKAI